MVNVVKIPVSPESLIFGGFIFLAYMLAKAPLLLGAEVAFAPLELFLLMIFSLFVTGFAIALLIICKKIYASLFLAVISFVFVLNLILGEFNNLGFFKYMSVSLFVSIISIVYCLLPRNHTLTESLLIFAGLLALYGVTAVSWGIIKGQQFSLREPIGINGPIIFGQLMIISSAIFLLFGNRKFFLAAFTAALSMLSFSKGPIVAGLSIFFLKRKIFSAFLIFIVIFFFMIVPIELPDNRVFSFFGSIYVALSSGDLDLLFSGSNYGSIGSRLEQYILAANLLSEFPYGIGVGQWGEFSIHEYPHNYFVEILVEQGWILGVISLLSLLIFSMKIQSSSLKYLLFLFLMFSMFSGSVLDNRGIYMVILLGLLYRKEILSGGRLI